MLDVEFIADSRPLTKPILYRFRTGALKQRVIVAILAWSESQGLIFEQSESDEFVLAAAAHLWDAYVVSEFPKDSDLWHRKRERYLGVLARQNEGRTALFVPFDLPLDEAEIWPQVRDEVLVIEEPEVSELTLPNILRCLEASTDLASGAGFCDRPEFKRIFDRLYKAGHLTDMSLVINAFEQVVLGCWDPPNRIFAPEAIEIEDEMRRAHSLSAHLRDLVALGTSAVLLAFVSEAAGRLAEVRSSEKLIAEVVRATKRLLRKTDDETDGRALIWTAVLIARLISVAKTNGSNSLARAGSDLTIVRLEQAARDFLLRANEAGLQDPLQGLWPRLREVVPAPAQWKVKSAAKLASALATCCSSAPVSQSPWRMKLHAWATEFLVKESVR